MDLNNDVHDDIEKVEPGELLEDIWFFGNLLQRKSRMLRSLSDPCTSLSSSSSPPSSENYRQEETSPEKSYEETYESIKKLSVEDGSTGRSLIRAPSDPSSSERKDKKPSKKGSDSHRGKSTNRGRAQLNSLNRAPSLPTSLQESDEENEFSMGKLIRQASMNYSDTLPPRKQAPAKALTPSSSISRYRSSRRKSELESIKCDLESEELRGFKDLGLDSDRKYRSSNAINIIPSLQEKKRVEEDEEKQSRTMTMTRPHHSEAPPAQSSAPPFPKWGGKAKRSNEDMKAQIKFWARAVASNVRQEC